MKHYEFLLFDLDRTLLDFDADMLMAFERLYRHCGFDRQVPYTPAMLDTYERYNNKWWKLFEDGQCTKPQLFRNRFVDFLTETGFSGDPDRMNEDYFRFLGQGGVAFPGALELLRELKRPVYLITNGNAATARTRIENAGLSPYVADTFVSEDVGHAKPDIRYFDYVFSHIPHFAKEKAVVIGDSPASDLAGARNAGVDSIWYHPDSDTWESPVSAPCTFEVKSYDDILRILNHE